VSFAPTTAERRALDQLALPSGTFAVLANDQRASLRTMRAGAGQPTDDGALRRVKSDVVATLAPYASAVLLDPQLSLPHLVDNGAQPGGQGLLVSIEESKDRTNASGRITTLLPDFGARGVRRLGGTAAKLLVTLRVDTPGETEQVTALVADAWRDCRELDLLLVVEVLVDQRPGEDEATFTRRFPSLLHDAAAAIASLGVVMLKLPYPGDAAACAGISELGVPWAVLSAGADFSTFLDRLDVAVDGGCNGFVVGRTLWQDAVVLDRTACQDHLKRHGVARLQAITNRLAGAKPWRSHLR
jgi:sulfofructosephosphate aldolase